MGVKWSQFAQANSLSGSDQGVGLQDGSNKRWTLNTLLAWIIDHILPSDIGAVPTTSVGVASGVASLDSSGKVPSAQLPAIPSTAAAVTYDNTGSGLSADDVQEAIDELAAGGVGGVDYLTVVNGQICVIYEVTP